MAEKLQITLPWPPKELSPNARVNRYKKARIAKGYRFTCQMIARETLQKGRWNIQPLRDLVEAGGEIHVFIDYCPPDRRERDDDNVNSAFKNGRDGLADALGIDDKHFKAHPFLKSDEIVKPKGEVRVVIAGKGPEA